MFQIIERFKLSSVKLLRVDCYIIWILWETFELPNKTIFRFEVPYYNFQTTYINSSKHRNVFQFTILLSFLDLPHHQKSHDAKGQLDGWLPTRWSQAKFLPIDYFICCSHRERCWLHARWNSSVRGWFVSSYSLAASRQRTTTQPYILAISKSKVNIVKNIKRLLLIISENITM